MIRTWTNMLVGFVVPALVPLADYGCAFAGVPGKEMSSTHAVRSDPQDPPAQRIDLPTVLRLSGTRNLTVVAAEAKLAEAQAEYDSARIRFFPWLSGGIIYRRHDHLLQDTAGNLVDVDKHSYAPGATVGMEINIGQAVYDARASRQLVRAAEKQVEGKQRELSLIAAEQYFDLLFAQANVEVAEQAVGIARDYLRQVEHAADAGLTFRGDVLRVKVQLDRNNMLLQKVAEERRKAAAGLAELLNLDPSHDLAAKISDLVPLPLAERQASALDLIRQAVDARPELKEQLARTKAAYEAKRSAEYGPLFPSLTVQTFVGGLGGGSDDDHETFGSQQNYTVGLQWRIGSGGLLDLGRVRASEARLNSAIIELQKLRNGIAREVIEAFTTTRSLEDQLATAEHALSAAQAELHLVEQRKQFSVGAVLEGIKSEEDLTLARSAYLRAVADFDKAQFQLRHAVGSL